MHLMPSILSEQSKGRCCCNVARSVMARVGALSTLVIDGDGGCVIMLIG